MRRQKTDSTAWGGSFASACDSQHGTRGGDSTSAGGRPGGGAARAGAVRPGPVRTPAPHDGPGGPASFGGTVRAPVRSSSGFFRVRWSTGGTWARRCPEPDLNRYAPEGQRGLSSPCLHSTIRAGHGSASSGSRLSGRAPATIGTRGRYCLILWASEGASDLSTGCSGPPARASAPRRRCQGLTEYRRPREPARPLTTRQKALSGRKMTLRKCRLQLNFPPHKGS